MALFEVRRLSPALGAQVFGVDFTKPLTAEQRENVEQLLLQYQVLFFRRRLYRVPFEIAIYFQTLGLLLIILVFHFHQL